MNLVTPKAEAKHELLFNEPALGAYVKNNTRVNYQSSLSPSFSRVDGSNEVLDL
jgi:hypothetical protein